MRNMIAAEINKLARAVHADNAKWWMNPHTGERIERNDGELFMLVASEIAEGYEGLLGGLADDKLPDRPMLEVEMADALIRVLDYVGARKLDLGGAVDVVFYSVDATGSGSHQLMRMVMYVAEAMEGVRKSVQDKATGRPAVEIALAKLWVHVVLYCERTGMDLEGAIEAKRAYNATRQDHTHEARLAAGGKKW